MLLILPRDNGDGVVQRNSQSATERNMECHGSVQAIISAWGTAAAKGAGGHETRERDVKEGFVQVLINSFYFVSKWNKIKGVN